MTNLADDLCDSFCAHDLAGKLLLEQKLFSLSFRVDKLRLDSCIAFDSMQNFCRKTKATIAQLEHSAYLNDGCTICFTKAGAPFYLVLYNENVKNLRRRNFTLAHEVGHIYLKHNCDSTMQERGANIFASQLILPDVLLWEYANNRQPAATAQEVCSVFFVSKQLATNALNALPKKQSTTFSHTQKLLLERYCPFLPTNSGHIITV